MGDEDVVLSGFLKKSPPRNKLFSLSSWQKRFFVLHANKSLVYFKNDKDKYPVKEPINLRACKCVESNLNHKSFKHVFSIVTDQRTYYLVADTQFDMENWVKKICEVCGFQRTDGLNSPPGVRENEYSDRTRPHPVTPTNHRPERLIHPPSSVSSSNSNVTSPTRPCPLSMPRGIGYGLTKPRSCSNPAEYDPNVSSEVNYGKLRRQSEQIRSPLCPVNMHSLYPVNGSGVRMSESCTLENYGMGPWSRPVSQEVYDILPQPKTVDHHNVHTGQVGENPDSGSPYQPARKFGDNLTSPKAKLANRLSSPQDDYDVVPAPRPVPQEVYDVVPPPQVTSGEWETYDFPPTLKGSPCTLKPEPAARPVSQDMYDVVPPPKTKSEDYDIPPPRKESQRSLEPEPAPRPSSQELYDVVQPPRTTPHLKPKDLTYDIVPKDRPPSQEVYDVVPPPRATPTGQEPKSLPTADHGISRPVESCMSDIYDVPPNTYSQDVYDWVPTPTRYNPNRQSDVCDNVSVTNRPVSADSGLNASFSSICSLRSENSMLNHDVDTYDSPLPELPANRDSGSLSDESPDYDIPPPPRTDTQQLYDCVPNRGCDVYDIPPRHPEDNYDVLPSSNDDIYDVPPDRQEITQDRIADQPVIDRSNKPPPMVNRSVKPKSSTSNPPYSNMPPPVNRVSKPRDSLASHADHSYMNCVKPPCPQNLPLQKLYSEKHQFGSLPNQSNQWFLTQDSGDYCEMEPTRGEESRCYSFSKDGRRASACNDQSYMDMSPLHTPGKPGTCSSSSSLSSLDDSESAYTQMGPQTMSSSLPVQSEQRRRRDLQYTEVQIVDRGNFQTPFNPTPRRGGSTHYTYINEASTRALQQMSNERKEKSLNS